MATSDAVSGEKFGSKVAAIFADAEQAREAAARVREVLALHEDQVRLVLPGDPSPGRQLEPEVNGIERTLVRSHVTMGGVGLVAGAAAWVFLYFSGIPMITQSALFSLFGLLFFGALGGLMVGGLLSLRPDHDPYVHKVLSSIKRGDSAVVVHLRGGDSGSRAETLLRERGGSTISTL